MKNGGIIRLISIFSIFILVCFYNFFDLLNMQNFKIVANENILVNDTFQGKKDEKKNQEKETEKTESQPEKEQVKAEKAENSSSTVQTSAQAVKGKIISQYISPYKASHSYDKVYLKNSTNLKIDLKSLLSSTLSFKIKKSELPQVLILHTHATETYMQSDAEYYTENFSSRTKDTSKNMVKIGEIVAKKLNDGGIVTLHDKTLHDSPQYSGSYTRAAKTITSYLKKYPSIKVVLDLHRDAVSSGKNDKVKLVTEINGKKAAQIMIVMGSQSGSVTNFPNWKENLKLAVKLQQTIEEKYPTLARPLSLMPKNYNESLTKGSLLLEFGTDANSLEEACYSAELVGDSILSLLKTLE